MFQFKITVTCFIFILSLCEVCQAEQVTIHASTPLPATMLGIWQVTDVLTDLGVKGIIQGLDDKYLIPKYHGRIFTLTPKRLSINTDDEICDKPEISIRKSTAAEIIAKSMSTRFPDPSHPTPHDMRLPLADDAPVEVLYLLCKNKFRSKDRGMQTDADLNNVVWFINLGNKQLAMSWYEQTILILTPVPENTIPVASFNCTKAGTIVEKTLCDSVGLAAYDQSLAQTYRLVMTYYRSKPNTKATIADLKKSQKEWLVQRDKCGTNVACLEKIMDIRVGDLIYDLGNYMFKHR